MKKRILICTAALALCACAKETVSVSSVPEETVTETEQAEPAAETETSVTTPETTEEPAPEATEEPEGTAAVIWAVQPELEIDAVEPLTSRPIQAFGASGWIGINEVFGPPQEWVKYETDDEGYIAQYTCNAVEFTKDGKAGIISYDGEVLYDGLDIPEQYGPGVLYDKTYIIEWQYYDGYVYDWKLRFTQDFCDAGEVPWGGIGVPDGPYTTVFRDGKLWLYSEWEDSEYVTENKIETDPFHSELGGGIIVPVYDEDWNYIGDGYIREGSSRAVMIPEGKVISRYIVDGFYAMSHNYHDDGTFDTLFWVEAASGEEITMREYDDSWYFQEGLCPVKRGGMWCYFDESGEEVTDAVFENACTVYEGKAFVKVNGKYGVIDLRATLDEYGYISADMLGGEQ